MPSNVKDFGTFNNANPKQNAAIIRAALNASSCVYFPEDTYLVDLELGPFTLSYGQQVYGDSFSWWTDPNGVIVAHGTIIKRSDGLNHPTFALTQGGNIIKQLFLQGCQAPLQYTGIGIEIGGTSYSDYNSIQDVVCQSFFTGLNLRAARRTEFFDCYFDSNYCGERYHAAGSMSSSMVSHYSCSFSRNQQNGILASQVPVRNLGLAYYSCNLEENNIDRSLNIPLYQCDLGIAGNVIFECCYFEHKGAEQTPPVTPPNSMNMSGMCNFTVSNCFFDGAVKHLVSTAVIDDGLITTSRFGSTQSVAVDMQAENIGIHLLSNVNLVTYNVNGPTSTVVTSKIDQF